MELLLPTKRSWQCGLCGNWCFIAHSHCPVCGKAPRHRIIEAARWRYRADIEKDPYKKEAYLAQAITIEEKKPRKRGRKKTNQKSGPPDITFYYAQRFRRLCSDTTPEGCIVWAGSTCKTKDGYLWGLFKVRDRNHYAHRTAWQLANGRIPKGMQLYQTCENSLCVNPVHLELRPRPIRTRKPLSEAPLASQAVSSSSWRNLREIATKDSFRR